MKSCNRNKHSQNTDTARKADIKSCVSLHYRACGNLVGTSSVVKRGGGVRPGNIIICSYSAAALMAFKGGKSEARPDLIVEIMTVLNRVSKVGNTVGFFWAPAHIEVLGN